MQGRLSVTAQKSEEGPHDFRLRNRKNTVTTMQRYITTLREQGFQSNYDKISQLVNSITRTVKLKTPTPSVKKSSYRQ